MRFDEPNDINDVAKFHKLFKLPVIEKPAIPSKDRIELRISLLEEELNELKTAISNDDLIEVADAFADLQYVLSGAILEFGLGERFKGIFDEVQRSNMSKTCKNLEEAYKTQEHYQNTRGVESFIEKSEDELLVYRKSDGKVLKSINYSPPDIEKMLYGSKK
jgi:predicted HAD superfamily Cof-like phosphohydrolase